MKNVFLFISMLTFNSGLFAQQQNAYFLSQPCLTADGQTVIFSFEGDLWKADINNGLAFRLTAMQGYETNPRISPDGKWLAFTGRQYGNGDVFVMPLNGGAINQITWHSANDEVDSWAWDNKSIYFTSNRYSRSAGYKVLATGGNSAAKKDSVKKLVAIDVPENIKIDMDRMMDRLELISTSFGSQYFQAVYQKGDKTSVLYTSNHGDGKPALWKTIIEPFEEKKTEKIAGTDNARSVILSAINDKYFILLNGAIQKLNLEQNKLEPVSTEHTFRRNLQQEFAQEFEEAWAQVQENYYDENFHGADWAKTKVYYQQFIPQLNNRGDLRILLNDMLGELNSSHQGFNTNGDDEKIDLQNRTMETGIVFDNLQPYKIKSIVSRSNADKAGIDIMPGDVLVKVNNQPVDPAADRNFYFTRPSLDKEINLTLNRNGKIVQVKIHPQPTLQNDLYDQWIDNNQQRVDNKSKNHLAYAYMKNMGTGELESFLIDMTKELVNKEALIMDLRYNTGGNVHDAVLNFLSQKSYLQWKYREGSLTRQPNFAPGDKPIVLLINEQSLSDAEMTAQGFKELKLGKIIGNETYRWIIFTSGVGFG